MSKNVTTFSDLNKKSEKEIPEHGRLVPFSGRGFLSMPSATEEIADGMAACSTDDNDNENNDEAKGKAAELSRTVKPVQESTPQQVYKEPNKGDVSQSQSNSKTSVCSNQSTSQTTKNVDWQFYIDTLAPHISRGLDDLAACLDIASSKLNSIRKEYTTEHEICFHLLWAWLENCHKSGANDDERLRALHNALREAGLTILTEEPMKTRLMYTFTGKVCNGSTNLKDGIETRKVAKGIGNVPARFGRYFKLKEEEITRVFLNKNNDSSKQAKEIIACCIQRGLLRTRQELCDGLNYVENTRLIEDMNEYWSK